MILTIEEKKITAFLAALCIFLSMLEYLIPKPLPFMRIGLANLPVLISLILLPKSGTFVLVLLKILGQGFINGTLFSYIFLFSAAGSLASGLVMISVYALFCKNITMTGICVLGALASNLVQIFAARFFIFGNAAFLIGPPFLAVGMASAVLLGLFTEQFIAESVWIKKMKKGEYS